MNCACGCGQAVPYSRGAKYASARCRAKASRQRLAPIPATVRAVRILKNGTQQVIVHVKPIWAVRAARGDDISVGGV